MIHRYLAMIIIGEQRFVLNILTLFILKIQKYKTKNLLVYIHAC